MDRITYSASDLNQQIVEEQIDELDAFVSNVLHLFSDDLSDPQKGVLRKIETEGTVNLTDGQYSVFQTVLDMFKDVECKLCGSAPLNEKVEMKSYYQSRCNECENRWNDMMDS